MAQHPLSYPESIPFIPQSEAHRKTHHDFLQPDDGLARRIRSTKQLRFLLSTSPHIIPHRLIVPHHNLLDSFRLNQQTEVLDGGSTRTEQFDSALSLSGSISKERP